jgi:carbon starvation protein CstA
MLFVFGIVARLAIAVGMAFVVGKTVPRLRNKVARFVFLFVVGVIFGLLLNYSDVRLFGYHKAGWTWALIVALIFAMFATFLPPQQRKSNISNTR